jgi:4-amino-4-deoxy-L-arabinose transferase-like glycosyltransferase
VQQRFLESPERVFFIALALLTLYRVTCLLQPHLVLFYDEAYYYHWSLNPDWGYYSKPPMVAWVIWLFTNMLGDTSFAIKLGAPILYGLSALLVYGAAERIWDSRAALMAGWVFITMPLVGYNSLFITTDAPLVFFWALTLWLFIRLWQKPDHILLWIALGVACGGGMLSKYTMALLPLGLFLFMACSAEGRALLTRPGPWVAAVLAGVIFGGNVWWNYANEFVAFRHTSEISGLDKFGIRPLELLAFWGAQIVVFGPAWSWLLLSQWRTAKLNGGSMQSLLWWACLPLFLVISLQALFSHAFINWAAPVFVAASLIAGKVLAQKGRRWFWVGGAANLILLSLIYHWPVILDSLNIERGRNNDPYFRVLGWDEIGREVAPVMAENPDALLLSDSRKLLAAVGFYAMPGEFRLAHWSDDPDYIADYYDLRVNIRDIDVLGQEYIWISEKPIPDQVRQSFGDVEFIGNTSVQVYPTLTHEAYIYRLQNYFP